MDSFYLISKYAICYGIFFLLVLISKLNGSNNLLGNEGPVRNPGILIGLHIAGILWLGTIPFTILNYSLKEIVFGNNRPDLEMWIGFFGSLALTLLIVYRHAQKTVRLKKWTHDSTAFFTASFLSKYFILRVIFLFVYETWFRGYLLTDSTSQWGIRAAIVVNVVLYVLLQLFSSRKEMLACIPFGIMLCVLSKWLGAAWPAIALHIAAALMYEMVLVKKAFYPVKNYRMNIIKRNFFLF